MWSAVKFIATVVDDAAGTIAGPFLDRLYDTQHVRAMADPAYARIDAQRQAGHPLPLEDVFTIQTIRDRHATHPWWEEPLSRMARRPVTHATQTVYFAWQRATRGWDDSATWSLDTHLASVLAAQLDHLAATTHGWPQGLDFPDFEDWQAALRTNAGRLRTYADGKFAATTPEDDLERQYADAQQALRWVAAHLGSLWD